MKDNIRKLSYLVIGLFMVLIFYLTYLQVYKGDDLAAHPKNRRAQLREAAIIRGAILDRNGEILVNTEVVNNDKKRFYTGGALVSSITGYDSIKYGKTGLEDSYNKYLLGLTDDRYWFNFKNRLSGQTQYGDDLVLSLDLKLQKLSQQLLGNRKGAVVALNPKNGEVLALYSNPGFDPNKIDEIWGQVVNQGSESPLVNRATQGLYPPGSAMKIVTGSIALNQDPSIWNKTYDSPGYIVIDGFKLNDHGAYGRIGFYQALQVSSNAVFARLGLDIGKDKFYQGAGEFGFGQSIPFDVMVTPSTLSKPAQMTKTDLGSSAIGQGKVQATPLQMALVAAAIANDGKMMAPRLVSRIKNHEGKTVKETEPYVLHNPVNQDTARLMRDAMVGVVAEGTGKAAQIPAIKVAGKTGSAENSMGKETHAWFIGFAPADNPQIALAVLVENAGYGGTEAAPIARDIIKEALK